jgi:hypothetical protein
MWLRPPKDMQVGTGFYNSRPVQVTRYMGVIICSGENEQARNMVTMANMGISLNNSDHLHLPTWGCQRCDLNFLEKINEKPHMRAIIKTWKFIHCHGPKQHVQGKGDDEGVKMQGNYKFSFDFSFWETDIPTLDHELKQAAQSHHMTNKWGNKVMVVPASRRSLGHKGKLDQLQAWDVHVQAQSMDEARQALTDLYMQVQARAPLVGYHKTFMDFDLDRHVVVEYSNSQALRDLQKQGQVDWVMLVAPGIAIIVANPMIRNLETLQAFIQVLVDYSKSWGKRQAHEGAFYFERLVLSKLLMHEPSIRKYLQENPKKDPRVVWQRHEDMTQEDARNTKTAIAQSETEVIVTCQGFPYQPREPGDITLEWLSTNQLYTWRLQTGNTIVAKFLCNTLLDFSVTLADSVAHLHFKSAFHMLAKE